MRVAAAPPPRKRQTCQASPAAKCSVYRPLHQRGCQQSEGGRVRPYGKPGSASPLLLVRLMLPTVRHCAQKQGPRRSARPRQTRETSHQRRVARHVPRLVQPCAFRDWRFGRPRPPRLQSRCTCTTDAGGKHARSASERRKVSTKSCDQTTPPSRAERTRGSLRARERGTFLEAHTDEPFHVRGRGPRTARCVRRVVCQRHSTCRQSLRRPSRIAFRVDGGGRPGPHAGPDVSCGRRAAVSAAVGCAACCIETGRCLLDIMSV